MATKEHKSQGREVMKTSRVSKHIHKYHGKTTRRQAGRKNGIRTQQQNLAIALEALAVLLDLAVDLVGPLLRRRVGRRHAAAHRAVSFLGCIWVGVGC